MMPISIYKTSGKVLYNFSRSQFCFVCFNGNSLYLMGCYEKTCKQQSVQWLLGTWQSMLLATDTFFMGQDGATKRTGFEIRLGYESWLYFFLIKITMNI